MAEYKRDGKEAQKVERIKQNYMYIYIIMTVNVNRLNYTKTNSLSGLTICYLQKTHLQHSSSERARKMR